MKFSNLRAGLNATMFCGLTAVLLGPYLILLGIAPKRRHVVAQLFFKGALKLTGLRLSVRGAPAPGVAMYTANHGSYLDIPVLGAVISDGVFVAKNEVAHWPVFGFLAKLSRTLFISRNPADAARQRQQLSDRMNQGHRLIMFPEGTSTNGASVQRFKSSLFAALNTVQREAWVQPVSIVYARHRDGAPLRQSQRELFTWFGDTTLAPHLLNVFGIKGCEVEVVFHAPFKATDCTDRKHLARACENVILDQVVE